MCGNSEDDVKMEDVPALSAEQERRIHELEIEQTTARAAAQEEIARLHEERIRALEAAQAARDAATRAEIARIRAAPAATVKHEVKPLTHRGVFQPGEVVDLTMED
jgi:membrane protein involved in colicin uptake